MHESQASQNIKKKKKKKYYSMKLDKVQHLQFKDRQLLIRGVWGWFYEVILSFLIPAYHDNRYLETMFLGYLMA